MPIGRHPVIKPVQPGQGENPEDGRQVPIPRQPPQYFENGPPAQKHFRSVFSRLPHDHQGIGARQFFLPHRIAAEPFSLKRREAENMRGIVAQYKPDKAVAKPADPIKVDDSHLLPDSVSR